jgi:RNA polymerase sigma-70 factor (ECF subfamily)
MQVAKRKAIDLLRRKQLGSKHIKRYNRHLPHDLSVDHHFHSNEIADNQLRLIFACCHPDLKQQDQIAFTLKTMSGFSIKEIAKALLLGEDVIKTRLYRARKHIIKNQINFYIPTGRILDARIGMVQTILYLLFNEGYYSTTNDQIIRKDLCFEAMRLTRLLVEHTRGNLGSTHALMALMCYHAARFESRLDGYGDIILLKDQNRDIWHRELIKQADYHLILAGKDNLKSTFFIEAAIASNHCHAPTFEKTNWHTIFKLYELLYTRKPFANILLNKAVVLLELGRYADVKKILFHDDFKKWGKNQQLYHSVVASYFERMGKINLVKKHLQRACQLSGTGAEKRLLEKRLSEL